MTDTHAINRTSPKGPGQRFVGTCMKCGQTGLTFADMGKECVNPAGFADEETLLCAIKGPDA